jgi:hypothetical protein
MQWMCLEVGCAVGAMRVVSCAPSDSVVINFENFPLIAKNIPPRVSSVHEPSQYSPR